MDGGNPNPTETSLNTNNSKLNERYYNVAKKKKDKRTEVIFDQNRLENKLMLDSKGGERASASQTQGGDY